MATINVPEEEENQDPLRGGAAGTFLQCEPAVGLAEHSWSVYMLRDHVHRRANFGVLVHQAWSALRGAPRKAPPAAPKRRDPSNLRPANFTRFGTVMIDLQRLAASFAVKHRPQSVLVLQVRVNVAAAEA